MRGDRASPGWEDGAKLWRGGGRRPEYSRAGHGSGHGHVHCRYDEHTHVSGMNRDDAAHRERKTHDAMQDRLNDDGWTPAGRNGSGERAHDGSDDRDPSRDRQQRSRNKPGGARIAARFAGRDVRQVDAFCAFHRPSVAASHRARGAGSQRGWESFGCPRRQGNRDEIWPLPICTQIAGSRIHLKTQFAQHRVTKCIVNTH